MSYSAVTQSFWILIDAKVRCRKVIRHLCTVSVKCSPFFHLCGKPFTFNFCHYLKFLYTCPLSQRQHLPQRISFCLIDASLILVLYSLNILMYVVLFSDWKVNSANNAWHKEFNVHYISEHREQSWGSPWMERSTSSSWFSFWASRKWITTSCFLSAVRYWRPTSTGQCQPPSTARYEYLLAIIYVMFSSQVSCWQCYFIGGGRVA